jgi:threonine synthase
MALSINPAIRDLCCSLTGEEYDPEGFHRPVGLCRCCASPGKPVVVRYDPPAVREQVGGRPPETWPGPGLGRFAPVLPVQGLPAGYADDVGDTPVARHDALSRELDVEVLLKNEGANPSGSFKDRGLAVGVALGAASGGRRFCLPTQGNAGVAASLFSARLGLPGCLVYMPEAWRGSIYHRACAAFGGEVRFAGGNIAAAGAAMRADVGGELARGEYVDISTFFEPGRLEGKKTMGYEIFISCGGATLPDVIVYPTGGGTGLVGIWKAFQELRELGLLDARARLPRMVTVQSERCAPVVEAFQRGLDAVAPVTSRGTVADGLDVPGAIMGHAMLQVLRDSGGAAVAVSEAEIVRAFGDYGRLGVPGGYESAATLAALRALRRDGWVREGERALLVNTGSHLIALARGLQES